MIVDITSELKIIEELASLKAEGRFVIVELLKQCKGKMIGKLVRKKSSNALLMKYKRGLRQLKEEDFIVNTGCRGYYMLNPHKFILFYDHEMTTNKFSFWYGLWYHLKYPDLEKGITVKRRGDIVNEIKDLWQNLPQAYPFEIQSYNIPLNFLSTISSNYSEFLIEYSSSWKDIILFEPLLVFNALYQKIIPFKKELNEVTKCQTIFNILDEIIVHYEKEYQSAVSEIKKILSGKSKKIENLHEQFDYTAYIAYKVLNNYFINEYPEKV